MEGGSSYADNKPRALTTAGLWVPAHAVRACLAVSVTFMSTKGHEAGSSSATDSITSSHREFGMLQNDRSKGVVVEIRKKSSTFLWSESVSVVDWS